MGSNWRPLLSGPLADQALRTVHEIAAVLPPPEASPFGRQASLAAGVAGQGLFYAYLALHSAEPAPADRAAELLDAAAEELANSPMTPSLHSGFAGVAWTLEHLQGRLFEVDDSGEDPLQEIDEALLPPLARAPWTGEYDLIGGLAGLGVYALERLPRPTGRTLLERIVDRLAEIAEVGVEGTAWFTPPERLPEWQREIHARGVYNLGVAHGLPGVLPVLAGACAAGVAAERARPLLDSAVRWLLARRLPPAVGSCYDTTYLPGEPASPSRLAWCYGDPGIATSLLACARAVGEPAWEAEAVAVALAAASRPVATAMIRDAGLCHGTAGLGHLFNRFYQDTGDDRFAVAARFWFERTLEFRADGEGIAGFRVWELNPDREPAWRADPGFLEGTAGIGLALLAAVSAIEPAWDRVLTVSLRRFD